MTGISEMFDELAGWEQQEFDWQFSAERARDYVRERNREYQRTRRAVVKSNPSLADKRREYMREYMREYNKHRCAVDVAYLEKRRKRAREGMRKIYERRRAERLAARVAA